MSIVERALVKAQSSNARPAEPPRNTPAEAAGVRPVGAAAGSRLLQTLLEKRAAERRAVHVDLEQITEGRFSTHGASADDEAPSLLEDFRRLKRGVRERVALSTGLTTDAPSTRLLMVTSAVPGEGKTFTSANLALSLALELDSWVLLVDGDVLRPKISRLLGLEHEPGLLDYLEQPAREFASVLYPTDQPRLAVVPAGKTRPTAHELFSSQRLASFIGEVANLYSEGVVVFDSPPALATSEPPILAAHVGQILFVVQSGETEQRAVIEGIQSLGEGRPVSLVLNRYVRPALSYGYSRYYKY